MKIVDNGKVYLNAEEEGDGVKATSTERDVEIEGNVLLSGNGGVFGAALNRDGSYLKGLVGTDGGNGKARLLLSHGARWMNTSVGNRDGNYASHLSHLKADNGAIFQEDDKTLTIDKYSGTGKLFYRHTGDGTRPEDYAGGDTHIKKADAGSSITVVTDRENIDTANVENAH